MTDLHRWLEAARDAEHPDYRAAMRELAQRGPAIATQIIELLQGPEGYAIMPVLLRWPSAERLAALTPLVGGKDHAAAWRAISLLGRSRDPAAVPLLAAQLGRARRRMAAQALGDSGLEQAIAPLREHAAHLLGEAADVDALADEDPAAPEQLAHVLHALGKLGDTTLARWLAPLADTAPEPQEREAAVAALAEVPVAEALAVASRALHGATGPLRQAALRTLWSYRTVAAIDALLAAAPPQDLSADVEAMLYDLARVTPAEWPSVRPSLPAQQCLLERQPLAPEHLIARTRQEAQRDLALAELTRTFGVRPQWHEALDDEAALYRELTEWKLQHGAAFAPGHMYRRGREVPAERLPLPVS